MKQFPKSGIRARNNKGFTLVEILIVSAIVAIGSLLLLNQVLGSKAESEVSDAQKQITVDLPTKLVGVYTGSGRSYASLASSAAGKSVITDRGIDASMPWGDTWAIQTAGTATAVTMRYTFTSASPSGQAALQQVYQNVCTTPAMTTATACTTIQPRYRMITQILPTFNATASTLDVTYGIPR